MKTNHIENTVITICGLLALAAADAEARLTPPAAWLEAQPKPAFKEGHTLPRLTRYGWAMPPDVRIKLCEDWGYALEFGNVPTTKAINNNGAEWDTARRLSDPKSPESQMADLAKSNPQRYPLSVVISQEMPSEANGPPDSFVRDDDGKVLYNIRTNPDGTKSNLGPVLCLEAPAATWEFAGLLRTEGLAVLQSRGIPISIILNGGEYAPGSWYQENEFWMKDSRYQGYNADNGYGGVWPYCSAARANIERIIATAVKSQVSERVLYLPYTAGGQTERNRFPGMKEYGGFWEHQRGIGDLPSNESYYKSNGMGFTEVNPNGQRDILTQALNAKALEITTGDPLSYNWISAGWTRGNEAEYVAEINRWTGFLKCYYTAGMIGCNVGDYEGPTSLAPGGYVAPFPRNKPPNFLKHLAASGHVHALFSQVEEFVRNSDLLPGPGRHEMSWDVPAYEFPTGDNTARCLARKHRTKASWLITAWAAGGADRNVTVYIPELGQLTLEARIVGSVYAATLANGSITLSRLDDEGATYTVVAKGKPVVTPVNLTPLEPTANNRLLWLAADSGVKLDNAGKVSAWTSQGSGSLVVSQADAEKRPTLVKDSMNGKPALRFVDSKTWLQGAIKGKDFDGGLTAFVVYTPASSTNKNVFSIKNESEFFGINDDTHTYDSVISNQVVRKISNREPVTSPMNAVMIGDSNQHGPGHGNGLTGDIAEVILYKNISPQSVWLVKQYLDEKYSLKKPTALANGSFEEPVVDGYRHTPNGTAWFFTHGALIQANGSILGAEEAPDGSQTAVLTVVNKQLGSLAQTLSLDAGTYTIRFKAARQPDGGMQPLKFSIDGGQIGELITPASSAFAEYKTSQFTAKAGQHVLRIEATNGDGEKSTFIDQIELVKDPVPTTR